MCRLSDDCVFTLVDVALGQAQRESEMNVDHYVVCKHDSNWYIGIVCNKSCEGQGLKIPFMILNKTTKSLSWLTHQLTYWIPFHDIICSISVLDMCGSFGRHYILSNEDYEICRIVYNY